MTGPGLRRFAARRHTCARMPASAAERRVRCGWNSGMREKSRPSGTIDQRDCQLGLRYSVSWDLSAVPVNHACSMVYGIMLIGCVSCVNIPAAGHCFLEGLLDAGVVLAEHVVVVPAREHQAQRSSAKLSHMALFFRLYRARSSVCIGVNSTYPCASSCSRQCGRLRLYSRKCFALVISTLRPLSGL
jgi:hypothetical protein